MHPDLKRLLRDAARLARGGLRAATTAAREALQGKSATQRSPGAPLHSSQFASSDDGAQGSFFADRFSDGHTHRDYKLYVPPQAGARALPLIVMLHGCTQDADDFAAGTRMNEVACRRGFFVLYPVQSRLANPQRCWNWFKHSHQQRGRGEPGLLAALTRNVMNRYAIDPARVYVAGLSAGGAMAAILGHAYPDLYAAVGVHSGLASGAAKDLSSGLAAMRRGAAVSSEEPRLPTIVFHGDADDTVHPDNATHVVAATVGPVDASAQIDRQEAAEGRGYTRTVHRSPQREVLAEEWIVHGSGHAWSGGSGEGSFTDPEGPDATKEMLRFFAEHARE